ncbi:GNAT family N-acetyltransferase [Acidihalobacter prosperus]|uniref:Acetyltransferase n=1 Tax=Acidihalobacter prosperus TaxID=160660 RepID=A0A1A6C6B3_9GAMM|nr:GNAT family N-acetyltransferase [Acidihalobacter prosperus]OBS10107.1 acetyltransferase [Acidihalobacter prosperus]
MTAWRIRPLQAGDESALWEMILDVAQAGESYPYAPDITRAEGLRQWCELPLETHVAVAGERVLGGYYIKANQGGPGGHVCNCGYLVASQARGRGVATALHAHSLETAKRLGFLAMQYNLVVSTNTVAVRLWQKLGFAIVGTLPRAFRHRTLGLVDAYVMYRWLGDDAPADQPGLRPTNR